MVGAIRNSGRSFSYHAFEGRFAVEYQEPRYKKGQSIILKMIRSQSISFKVQEFLSNCTCADLAEIEISNKPLNWNGNPEEVKGANLKGKDLRFARARKVFLVRADLRGAQLQGADLQGAQLQGAELQSAKFQGADLQGADCKEPICRTPICREPILRENQR